MASPSHPASMEPAPQPLLASKAKGFTGCLKWLCLTLISLAIIAGAVGWKWASSISGIPAALLERAMKAWSSEQVLTHVFRESLISITATQGDVLELATMEMDETLARYDMKTALGNLLYLGTTVSEVRVPAVFRYHIKINEPWQVTRRGHECLVIAPALRASQPPAIRTDRMEKHSESGWLRFNAADNMAELEKSITPTLAKRAENPGHKAKVREASRKAVAEFIQKWLLKEETWSAGEISAIRVVFADEPGAADPATVQRQAPVMSLP